MSWKNQPETDSFLFYLWINIITFTGEFLSNSGIFKISNLLET